MQTTVVSNMIYIGHLPVVDTDEFNYTVEFPGVLLGSYSFPDLKIVAVSETDLGGDGIINDDEDMTGDYVEFTLDGVDYQTVIDATMHFTAKVTTSDAQVHEVDVAVLQTPLGDTFVTEVGNDGSLDNLDITSIQLTSVLDTNFYGHHTGYSVDNTTVCIARGSWIDTATGPRRIETLAPGTGILTADHGILPLRWIARLSSGDSAVALAPGSLGQNCPARRLVVSPQHRILLRSRIAARLLGQAEVLLPAKRLVGLPGIRALAGAQVPPLYHLGFDRHELIRANGAWTESLLPGPVALANLPPALRRRYGTAEPAGEPARPVPPGPLQKEIVRRHARNGQPLVENAPQPLSLSA